MQGLLNVDVIGSPADGKMTFSAHFVSQKAPLGGK